MVQLQRILIFFQQEQTNLITALRKAMSIHRSPAIPVTAGTQPPDTRVHLPTLEEKLPSLL